MSTLLGLQSAPQIALPITGFNYRSSVSMPDKSLLLAIYQDSNQSETRYRPAQALQNCFWFSHLISLHSLDNWFDCRTTCSKSNYCCMYLYTV
jgi:hypothetical protein